MGEFDVIKQTGFINRQRIEQHLIQLGLKEDDTVLVHSSLSRIGWVCGGEQTVITALMNVLKEGTIIMPAHTPENSDPKQWENPPVPNEWHEPIRANLPPFDMTLSRASSMGIIADSFRQHKSVIRSNHPQFSFTAWGKHALSITSGHSLSYGLGENSPLAKIYNLSGKVLLLGVDHNSNTSFHLSEYRSAKRKEVYLSSAIKEKNERKWKTFKDIEFNNCSFEEIGKSFENNFTVRRGKVGFAESRLFYQKDAVDYAVSWLNAKIKEK